MSTIKKSTTFEQQQVKKSVSEMVVNADEVPSVGIALKVNPADFMEFLPWACAQMGVDAILLIKKDKQVELPAHGKGKGKKSKTVSKAYISDSDQQDPLIKTDVSAEEYDEERSVNILATYKGDNLTHVKFYKSKHIPKNVLHIFGLVIKFYPHLYGISINSGLDKYTIYELSKFLPLSNITELCFDDAFCKEANYDMLLDYCKNLTMLSLCRCKITDEVLENIAEKLTYQKPASFTLSILNLSSNQLSDKSAKILAKVLRTNRRLNYLNLAGNWITDEGAKAILDILRPFPFTIEEIMQNREKYMKFSKDRRELINQIVANLQSVDTEPKHLKKKMTKPVNLPTNKLAQAMIYRGMKPLDPIDKLQKAIYESRAEDLADSRMGYYFDPVGTDSYVNNGWIYSNGNNTLAYFNMAYNSISYVTLNLIVDVLKHQKYLSRKPRGLVNVCLEGNPLPKCEELDKIDYLLDIGLRVDRRMSSVVQHHRKASAVKLSPGPKHPKGK